MSAASPYRGLAPFEDTELDALYFFGRERDTEIVVANLIASRLTVLYGPSGVGKSSLLFATVMLQCGGRLAGSAASGARRSRSGGSGGVRVSERFRLHDFRELAAGSRRLLPMRC